MDVGIISLTPTTGDKQTASRAAMWLLDLVTWGRVDVNFVAFLRLINHVNGRQVERPHGVLRVVSE